MDKLKVVIAEDEAIIRLDLKEVLEEQGYEVVAEVSNGEEAILAVKQFKPDVALLDIKMPGVDGLEAAREISALNSTAIVFLTAFSQRDLIEQARDAKAVAYLVKPFQKEELIPAIEIAVARFKEAKALEAEVSSLEERLEVRKLLDRAKSKLMDQYGLSESESYRFIQTQAMSRRITMKDVANEILEQKLSP
jgi:AmiR/NasT family two-component response regulator